MHPSAMKNCQYFFDVYARELKSGLVLDIGSQDVNGSLSEVCPKKLSYVGIDFVDGKGVDVILKDPYSLPFPDNHADIIVSSSCFEHSEMFWVVFLEIMRVLKPTGIFYLNVPSNGSFHRYPVDCWRFYPDSGKALETWAKHNKINACLLESYTSAQDNDVWNDYVAVFLKDETKAHCYCDRIAPFRSDVENAYSLTADGLKNYQENTQDQRDLAALQLNYLSINALVGKLVRVFNQKVRSGLRRMRSGKN